LSEIRHEYRSKLLQGEIDLENDMYGCDSTIVTKNGDVMAIAEAASDVVPHFLNQSIAEATSVPHTSDDNFSDNDCGVKRLRRRRAKKFGDKKRKRSTFIGVKGNSVRQPPLLKGAKMIDKRTLAGKQILAASVSLLPRELAARAALARTAANDPSQPVGAANVSKDTSNNVQIYDYQTKFNDSDESDDDDCVIRAHEESCTCRCCDWDRLFFPSPTKKEDM
jgi:hypothetical protein